MFICKLLRIKVNIDCFLHGIAEIMFQSFQIGLYHFNRLLISHYLDVCIKVSILNVEIGSSIQFICDRRGYAKTIII